MADISPRTQNVSIQDDTTANLATVNSDNDLLVHDQDAQDILQEIAGQTGDISNKTATSWQFFAENDLAFVSDYSATIGTPAAETNFILLHNPVDSGYVVRIKAYAFSISTASTTAQFSFYKDVTVTTNGTPLSIENYRTNGVTGVATTFHTPTITTRGEIFKTFSLNSGGVGISRLDEDLSVYVLEGEFFLITVDPSAVNKAFSANLSWAEELIPV